jgi:tetratricopeptide (TPR) repeat protein
MYRTYLEGKPGDRFAMYSLALELKKEERVVEAEAAFEALLKAHVHSGAGHYQLGLMYEELDREDEARASWERGLDALKDGSGVEVRRSVSEIQTALDLL